MQVNRKLDTSSNALHVERERMSWTMLCRHCFQYYEETLHREKDLCLDCRATLPITRKRKEIRERVGACASASSGLTG